MLSLKNSWLTLLSLIPILLGAILIADVVNSIQSSEPETVKVSDKMKSDIDSLVVAEAKVVADRAINRIEKGSVLGKIDTTYWYMNKREWNITAWKHLGVIIAVANSFQGYGDNPRVSLHAVKTKKSETKYCPKIISDR